MDKKIWSLGILKLKSSIDINTIIVSDKACFGKKGFKYFIGN